MALLSMIGSGLGAGKIKYYTDPNGQVIAAPEHPQIDAWLNGGKTGIRAEGITAQSSLAEQQALNARKQALLDQALKRATDQGLVGVDDLEKYGLSPNIKANDAARVAQEGSVLATQNEFLGTPQGKAGVIAGTDAQNRAAVADFASKTKMVTPEGGVGVMLMPGGQMINSTGALPTSQSEDVITSPSFDPKTGTFSGGGTIKRSSTGGTPARTFTTDPQIMAQAPNVTPQDYNGVDLMPNYYGIMSRITALPKPISALQGTGGDVPPTPAVQVAPTGFLNTRAGSLADYVGGILSYPLSALSRLAQGGGVENNLRLSKQLGNAKDRLKTAADWWFSQPQ